jgi:hypothetical protein
MTTMSRLQMPVFGGELLAARRAGVHPYAAHVVMGGPQRATVRGAPAVWVGPRWRPGTTDWRMLAGLPVDVWCTWPFGETAPADDEAPEAHPVGWLGLIALAGEVARVAAPVQVLFQDLAWADCGPEWVRDACDARWLAQDARRQQRAVLAGAWPAPWSDQLAADYHRRLRAWIAAPLSVAA